MSTPRPTEADVEALAKVLLRHGRAEWIAFDAKVVADAVLRSDWLAARDAEHQREVEARSIRADLANLRAERWMARHDVQRARAEAAERDRDEARRELADLRAKVAALAADFDTAVGFRGAAASLRALLPTEDDQ